MEMMEYSTRWGKKYHFDNVYRPLYPLTLVKLYQAGEIIAGDNFLIPEHIQSCAEISYVVSGEGDFCTDDQVFHAKEGDIHVISPGKRHRILTGSHNLRMTYIGFYFYEDGRAAELEDFYLNAPMHMKNERLRIKAAFEQLLTEIYLFQYRNTEMIDAYITQILIQVYRLFRLDQGRGEQSMVEETRMKRIVGNIVFQSLRYIDEHIAQIESARQVADALGYHPAYISRVFREKTGMTIAQYLASKKTEMAKAMLAEGLSVSDTAQKLGYATPQSFCKMFRRSANCTPSEYKKRHMPQK